MNYFMEIFECGELSRCLLMIFEIGDKVHLQVCIMYYFRNFSSLNRSFHVHRSRVYVIYL